MSELKTYTVRLKHDSGVIAIKTTATTWTQAVAQCLKAELAPPSSFLNCYEHITEGYVTVYGARVTKQLAEAYNQVNDHVHAWQALGKAPPEHLLNGRFNLLMSAAK